MKAKSRGQHSVGKLRLYEILYALNQSYEYEQVLVQLQNWKTRLEGTSRGTPSA